MPFMGKLMNNLLSKGRDGLANFALENFYKHPDNPPWQELNKASIKVSSLKKQIDDMVEKENEKAKCGKLSGAIYGSDS